MKLYLRSLYPGNLWQISMPIGGGIVESRINAFAFCLYARSFGECVTMCLSLQAMIMFSIIVKLSALSFLSSLCVSSRVAVIRGSVVLQDGSPLVGVNITFPQHPEYGYTISRQDGR